MEGLVSKDEVEHLGTWRRFWRSGEGLTLVFMDFEHWL